MRFIPDGPDIPDELIAARDRGDVVFFCGAGVSRQNANLPDFNSLAQKVIDRLGSARSSPARQLFARATNLAIEPSSSIPGLGSLVATDRIFGLLEREFQVRDIQNAVSEELRPQDGYTLDAHQILLDLATDQSGVVRLVTTNFDRLFQECRSGLTHHAPPRLPNPLDEREFRGIIHLHGCVDEEYQGPHGEEFVISSADFGRAYLADGWATNFIRALLERFCVVFVGFTADDPPIQYLLEALHLKAGANNRIFAFHNGGSDEAAALWKHRGVQAIACNGFTTLWDSLGRWAERARDKDGWYDEFFRVAANGPENLSPHQRGVFARLLGTPEGARKIAVAPEPADARWLLVADPIQRYAAPSHLVPHETTSERLDPFELLSLDDDPSPPPPQADHNPFARREPNSDAFDPLTPTESEMAPYLPAIGLRGHGAIQQTPLPPRLSDIGIWIGRISHQPITLWWAAHQKSLHPQIILHIERLIRQSPELYSDTIRKGWYGLFAAWADRRDDPRMRKYDIEGRAKQDGWSLSLVRELAGLYRPQVTASYASRPHPLFWKDSTPERLLQLDVVYPRPHEPVPLPPAMLTYAVSQFRGNLDLAAALEREYTGSLATDLYLQTTRADDGGPALSEDQFQLTGHLIQFQNLMAQLLEHDAAAACSEAAQWPMSGSVIYERLNIWAASQPGLSDGKAASAIFLGLRDEAFWSSKHQRDLLYALRDRWMDFDDADRMQIEERLRTGSYPWPETVPDGRNSATAYYRLQYLHWLRSQGVLFAFDVEAEIASLREHAPDWHTEAGDQAADSNIPVVRTIGVNDDPDTLVDAPIADIPRIAREMHTTDFFATEYRRPFAGLAATAPKRAFLALTFALRAGVFDDALWSQFLISDARASDDLRMNRAIGARLLRLSKNDFQAICDPVSRWMRATAGRLFTENGDLFQPLWDRAISSLEPDDVTETGGTRDLPFEALNSSLGQLFETHMEDPAKIGLAEGQGFPTPWLSRLKQLIETPANLRQQALVRTGHQISWLYMIDSNWVETNLLPIADRDDVDADALWEGYFWAGRVGTRELLERLKPAFLRRVSQSRYKETYTQIAANILLAGWAGDENNPAVLSDEDVRESLIASNENLRRNVISNLGNRLSGDREVWTGLTMPFLRNVWPKQSAVYTASVSARLAEFAVSAGDLMPEIVAEISRRLVPGHDGVLHSFFYDNDKADHAARAYPAATLDLLWAILSEQVAVRPYKIDEVLDILAKAQETSTDPRLAEIRRRYRV